MAKSTGEPTRMERRGFLKGSAWFAAGIALAAAAPAAAQAPQAPQAPSAPPEEKKEEPKKDEPETGPKTYKDKEGRDYRVCDMCGANMYKTEKTWTCEQCGYSYEE